MLTVQSETFGQMEEAQEQKVLKEEYIVCLICEVESDEGFALYHNTFRKLKKNSLTLHRFRPDLDQYCNKLKDILVRVRILGLEDEATLKDHLAGWYMYTVGYWSCSNTVNIFFF